MKKLEIKTVKATLLVVDLPKEGVNPWISMGYIVYKEPNYKNWATDDILMNPIKCIEFEKKHNPKDDYKNSFPEKINEGDWKHLGKPSEITEDVWKGIVDTGVDFVKETTHYIDYLDESSLYRTAAMSGLSLLKANGVITENKYQDDWDELCIWGHGDFSKDGKSSHELYMEEAEKVWGNPHIFIKID